MEIEVDVYRRFECAAVVRKQVGAVCLSLATHSLTDVGAGDDASSNGVSRPP